jgi:LuxR family transcriptional regulator
MIELEDAVRKISIKHHDRIKKASQPLTDYFGVSHFSYIKIKNSGKLTLLSSKPAWLEFYCAEKLYLNQPHFRHPSNFLSGISLGKSIQGEEYEQLSRLASTKFNVNFCLGIITKVEDGLEIIGLDAFTPSVTHDALLLNNMNLIHKFVSVFKQKNKFLLDLLVEHQIDIASLLGQKFLTAETPILENSIPRDQFLKDLGFTVPYLSLQEKKVIKHLLFGYSARQSAEALFLSIRTIEHYIERIKGKLGVYSKQELILKAKDLEALGFLGNQ